MTVSTPHFAGRTETFNWLQLQINQVHPPQVLLLTGPAKIGRTAVLHELHRGRLGPDFIPVFVDLAQLLQHTTSVFFWEFAQAAATDFNQKRHTLEAFEQTDFVANPLKALDTHFLSPVLDWLDGRRLILLLDNLHKIRMNPGESDNGKLPMLLNWLGRQTAVTGIFTLPQETAKLAPEWADTLAGIDFYFLEPMRLEEVADFFRQAHIGLMADEVVQQIFKTTGGQPTAVQSISQFLHGRVSNGLLNQFTLADLVMAQKMGIMAD